VSEGPKPPDEVVDFYALGLEKDRLDEDFFPLERARTQELILRHLPPPPGTILDVGGAAGAYALWLAERGYAVHLVDPVPLHVRQAEEAASAEAVLLLGPLYHLIDRADRLRALAEARRVLKPSGLVFAAAISRFASLVDGLRGTLFDEEVFARMVERDLTDGQHRNDTGNPRYFTTAFFHHPDELATEVRGAGFALEGVFAIEGPGAFVSEFQRRWNDPGQRQRLLAFLRRVEREPSLLGVSPHLLALARRP